MTCSTCTRKLGRLLAYIPRKTPNMLVDNTGRLIIDEHEVLEAWSGYIAEVVDDNRSDQPDTTVSVEGPEILVRKRLGFRFLEVRSTI